MPRSRPADARVRVAASVSLDLLCFSARNDRLKLLVRPSTGRSPRAEVPWRTLDAARSLTAEARRFATTLLGAAPSWMTPVATLGDGSAHPSGAPLSIAYAVLAAADDAPPPGLSWVALATLPSLSARQVEAVGIGLEALRERVTFAPIAFRMLPAAFTLSELQRIYELLLDRPLHKASFRRALQASGVVAPTEEWRSEGRGRPARLYRYAPPKRRPLRRPVRFDLLG